MRCSVAISIGSCVYCLSSIGGAQPTSPSVPPSASTPPLAPLETSPGPETLSYTEPSEANSLRAVLQLQTVFLTGFLYYVTTTEHSTDWDVNYNWDAFERKLTGQSFGSDSNHFGTNFIGHPLGGTGYYLAARANQLGIYESALFSFFGSLIWEFFGEVSERVSFNDMLVTPMAGWAIGEATFQLGNFFDRSGPALHNRVLGSAFAPLKSVNDWLDGRSPVRATSGFPKNEWHRFELNAGTALVEEDSQTDHGNGAFGELRFSFKERLARLTHYGRQGYCSGAFGDARVSGIELEGALTPSGVTDLGFRTHVVLAGYHHTAAGGDGADAWGGSTLVGVGVGFEYSLHDYERGRRGRIDRISTIQPLTFVFENRLQLGEAVLSSYVDTGPNFGGVNAFGLGRFTGNPKLLPKVAEEHGYYFALGGYGAAKLDLTWRRLELGADFRTDLYGAVGAPGESINTTITDTRKRFAGKFGYKVPDSAAGVYLQVQRNVRSGSVDSAHVLRTETSYALSSSFVF